jgi:hypothetical protein
MSRRIYRLFLIRLIASIVTVNSTTGLLLYLFQVLSVGPFSLPEISKVFVLGITVFYRDQRGLNF